MKSARSRAPLLPVMVGLLALTAATAASQSGRLVPNVADEVVEQANRAIQAAVAAKLAPHRPKIKRKFMLRARVRGLDGAGVPEVEYPPEFNASSLEGLTEEYLQTVNGWQPGIVPGAPSTGDFNFSSIEARCNASDKLSAKDFPISLGSGDPLDMLVTQVIAQQQYAKARHWSEHIEAIQRFLPKSSAEMVPGLKQFRTCAIVGNHGNLLHNSFGEQINQHDAVFRMNRGPTRSREIHVGNKTTFRLLNNAESRIYSNFGTRGHQREKLPLADNATIILSRVPPDALPGYLKNMYRWVSGWKNRVGTRYTLLNRQSQIHAGRVLRSYRNCLALGHGQKDPEAWMPLNSASSGLAAIMGSIHLCAHVTVYGIGEDAMTPTTPYQYFQNKSGKAKKNPRKQKWGRPTLKAHNFELERLWIDKLANDGLIRKCEAGRCYGKDQPDSITAQFHPPVIQEVIDSKHGSAFATQLDLKVLQSTLTMDMEGESGAELSDSDQADDSVYEEERTPSGPLQGAEVGDL